LRVDIYHQIFSDNDRLNEDNPEPSSQENLRERNEPNILDEDDDVLARDIAGQLQLRAMIAETNAQSIEVFTGCIEDTPVVKSHIENVRLTQQFIQEISTATLDNGKLDEDVVWRLRNPVEGSVDITNPDIRLSLDLFIGCKHTSEATYHAVWDAILQHFPDSNVLSYHLVKKLVAEYSGVVSVLDDMCIN